MVKGSFIEQYKKEIIAEPSGKTYFQLQIESKKDKMNLTALLQNLIEDQDEEK